jgi:CRISPR-associated protein Cas2
VFVSVVLEPGSEGREAELDDLLMMYGFNKVQNWVWESISLKEKFLPRIKRDIDRRTDYYDKVRLYQFPLEGTLAVSTLEHKRWKRVLVKA